MTAKNAFILILLCLSYSVAGTTYYIDPSGNNSNNGSSSSPWKTLVYACSKATTSGDIIHVNAGTYTETAQSSLAVGVSIEGVGKTSIIHSTIAATSAYTLLLSSSSQGANGNQSISNIRMEGGLNAYGAILIDKRKNVSINHCEFEDFFTRGVTFTGSGYFSDDIPAVYATGNTFHDNILTNCADYEGSGHTGSGFGNLEIGGQEGMLVYNNTITQKDRGTDSNGFCIKYTSNGYCKGLKIYNNTIIKPPFDGSTWDFSIELWNCRGGIEIYSNNIQGSIDFGGNTSLTNDAGGYGFAVKVYKNTLGQTVLRTREENGIDLEREQTGGFYVYNNLFKNLTSALVMYQGDGDVFNDFYVYYNIFNNIGTSGQSNYGNGIDWETIDIDNITYDNINFLNNTISAGTDGNPQSGLRFNFHGNATNLTVRNNIIQGFKACPVYMETSGTITNLSIENNIFYNNGNTNQPKYGDVTPTNNTIQNNIVSNPLFSSSSDFHLQVGSPAIGKGLKTTGITTDFDGNTLNTPPSVGAYEFIVLTQPVYQNSVIENVSPSILAMTYNMTLANIVPSSPAFSVLVNSSARAVSSVSISGTKIQLTLASPIVYGDVVTVSYTKPSSNPLQTIAGGQAASISGKSVTNNCISNIPVYSASVVENTAPLILAITYNMTLANIVPANTSFSVLVNSIIRPVTSVAISGTRIQLTLASPIVYGDVVTVFYSKPSSNPLQTIAGGQAATISGKSVTNNCISNIPVYSASVVENSTPSIIEMSFSLNLANIVPSNSAFNVQVNSAVQNVTSVTISGNKVQLTLGSGVKFGDIITVSYTKPVSNPLQTSSGAQSTSISNQPVTNNCNDATKTNNPPVVVINYAKTIYEGFVSEIDATSTYDPNDDSLIVEWSVPNNVPVSGVQSFKTEFLAPIVDNSKTVNFDLKVSDGKTILANAIPVTVLPYKPELNEARITNIIASTYLTSDYPEYIIDGNIKTKWSSDGDNQWLILTLAEPFRISHLMIAFLQEQNYESYFDIYGSKDNVIWESILTSAVSCKFSGERQIFDIPALNSNSEYSYLKYVGHGNSLNYLNSVSEIKIFGTPQQVSKIIDHKGNNITIYPNPTQNYFNISINEPDYNLNSIRIFDISGKIVFEYPFDHIIDNVRLPDNLNSGVYLVEFRSGKTILDTQKLIIEK